MAARTTSREVQSQIFFVVANIGAGLLHYLYQVFASKNLPGAEFAELNRWFADLALFFVIGGVLQYAANFFPVHREKLIRVLVVVNLALIALAAAWFSLGQDNQPLKAVIIVLSASLFGWVLGQLQARLMFTILASAQLVVAIAKLLTIFLPLPLGELEKYRYALFIGYFPALWLISVWIVRTTTSPVDKSKQSTLHLWIAPLILSAATAVIPQMDLALVGHLQSALVDIEFTRASLFYKGIYFFVFIFAQLFLPHQIAGRWNDIKPSKFLGIAAALSLIGSAAITFIAPFVGQLILGWSEQPSAALVFLSCLNMSLLAWFLLLLQEACARSRTREAALALGVLALEVAGQLSWHGTIWDYYMLAIPVQILVVSKMAFAVRRALVS